MRVIALIALVGLAAAVPTTQINSSPRAFDTWKAQFGKVYTGEEHEKRLAIFQANAAIVEKHNSEGHSWTMGLTQFADLTPKEFESLMTLRPSTLGTDNSTAPARHVNSGVRLPSSIDWRTQNVVNEVKNQEQCGSCWAFSTVVSYEGQVAKKTGKLSSFSEQDLVDCVKDTQQCCDGCQGGLMDAAFEYMMNKQSGKDELESTYPYTAADGTCKFAGASGVVGAVTKYTDIKKGDEDSLKDAVATIGPISVAVDANMFWQLYQGGVFSPLWCPADKLDHGVAVVGYGTDGGDDYWIIRNSWGKTWGEEGYMRLKAGSNICGVANSAVYPTVA